jgi:uncharacterized protein (UPF0276 family)
MTMTQDALSAIPALGAGVGYRDPYRGDLFLNRGSVDFLEIVADHHIDPTPGKRDELALLRDHFVLIPHGLNLSLGSAEGPDPDYVRRIAALVNGLKPPYWSEHLAVTRAGGVEIGHLAPLPFTREAVDTVCRNVDAVRSHTGVPLILENITYTIAFPGNEMTEAEFLTQVTDRTGCGLLLDVTNLYINAVNHGYDLETFLSDAPLDRVVQLHFTGGVWEDGALVDSHSEPTPPEVWALLEEVVRRAPVKGVILERDENLPPFAEILGEVTRAREIGRRAGRWD